MPPDGSVYRRIYAVVYAPQDRLVERLFPAPRARGVVTFVANFGLSTQLAALGVCLLLGRPDVYLWVPLACLAALVPLVRPGAAPVPETS